MSELQTKIMRRVYIIRALRRFISPIVLKAYASVFLFALLVSRVSIADVFKNVPKAGDVESQINFFTAAFSQTENAIKFLIVAGALLFLWLGKDVFRSIFTTNRTLVRQTVR